MKKEQPRLPGFVIYSDGGYDLELAKASVGEGWGSLIEEVFQKREDMKRPVNVIQVKEKWGGLRIYTDFINEEFDNFIVEIEKKSYTICEVCGNPGVLREINSWYHTRCNEHADGAEPIKAFDDE